MSQPTLNAKFEDELGPRIWVDPNADNEQWNNIVRKVLADARVKRHMVDVTAIASWSVWPDGSFELHVLLELHIARAPIDVRQALPSMYARWLLVSGEIPTHPYVLDTPHPLQGVPVTVQHNHNYGSGDFYTAGQDAHFTKNHITHSGSGDNNVAAGDLYVNAGGDQPPWDDIVERLDAFLDILRDAKDEPEAAVAFIEVEAARRGAIANNDDTVRHRLQTALNAVNPTVTFWGGLASLAGAVIPMLSQ